MRTSFDIPDALYRELKTRALKRGTSVRSVLLELIEAGMSHRLDAVERAQWQFPVIDTQGPLPLRPDQCTNAALFELLE